MPCIFLQEVQRIKNEHPDDACAISNDRVKGSLKVTRAFGAGFLKKVCINYQALVYLTVANFMSSAEFAYSQFYICFMLS